jgi:hypothetical protein
MNLIMPWMGTHPESGEEVRVMDDASNDVDVHVGRVSISSISSRKERMGRK